MIPPFSDDVLMCRHAHAFVASTRMNVRNLTVDSLREPEQIEAMR
jgi:hypothetical protein